MHESLPPITASWREKPSIGTARAWIALIAGHVGVVEIRAARALEEVAACRCLVAQLTRSAGDQRPRQHAIVAADTTVGGEVSIAHERPDPKAAVLGVLDDVEAETVDIDEVRGGLNLELHEVEEIGPAGDELGALDRRRGRSGLRRRGGALVAEGSHALVSATSWMAARMLA